MSTFTRKCDTRQNPNSFPKSYGGSGGISFEVVYELPDGTLGYFRHSDPRVSVKTRCEELGIDFESVIVQKL